jgi:hypothetical protein
VLLAVIGRNWIESRGSEKRLDDPRDFVKIEIETALERRIPIVPLLVQAAPMPNEEDLPPSLRPLAYYNAISIRPDPDFHQDMTRLVKGTRRTSRRRSRAQGAGVLAAECTGPTL